MTLRLTTFQALPAPRKGVGLLWRGLYTVVAGRDTPALPALLGLPALFILLAILISVPSLNAEAASRGHGLRPPKEASPASTLAPDAPGAPSSGQSGQSPRSASAASTPGFTYYAENQDLAAVLMAFARSQGLAASVSPSLVGKVSGRFTSVPPNTFLGGMRSAFGVGWYRVGPSMHFYNEGELGRTFFTPRSMSTAALYSILQKSPVCSPQLPPSMAQGGSMIVVSGPPAYLEQVSLSVQAIEESQASQMVMKVFPLKYAWAEDMTVNSQDKNVVVPGVASILRAMLSGPTAKSPATSTQERATVGKLSGQGLVSVGQENNPQHADTAQNFAPPAASAPQQAPAGPAASIMADQRVNAVLVSDAAYRMPYYEKVIADLDKPVELVEIHVAIVDIDANSARTLGVNYQWGSPRKDGWSGGGEFGGDKSTFGVMPKPGTIAGAGLSLTTVYTHGADYFLSRVQLLEKQGEARMLGRPSVLTVDNVQATLENTTTFYIQVQGYQAVDLFKVDSGTVLRVTPHIIRDDVTGKASIKLVVSVQDGQNSNSSVSTSAQMAIPPIKQTRINTQAIVGAEQSLLIGGYSYEQKGVDASGIPILMNIPLLGNLFKTSTNSVKRVERLILITPKIIDLNNLPAIPERLDEPAFHTSPTQSDYSERVPNRGGGCTRKVSRFVEEPMEASSWNKDAPPVPVPVPNAAGATSGGSAGPAAQGSPPAALSTGTARPASGGTP